jgi:hypothetical protein
MRHTYPCAVVTKDEDNAADGGFPTASWTPVGGGGIQPGKWKRAQESGPVCFIGGKSYELLWVREKMRLAESLPVHSDPGWQGMWIAR